MINRRIVLGSALASVGLLATPARATVGPAFTQAAFEAAQKAGKSIVVVAHAPWCPTCRVQEPIIKKLLGEAKYKGVVIFNVDFDSQKDVLRKFNISKQSTLVAFKGAKETKRSTGVTESMSIEDIVESSL